AISWSGRGVPTADLPVTLRDEPDGTPGRRSFENLVGVIRRCLESGLAPAYDDPCRLASLIWTAEHGLVLARIWQRRRVTVKQTLLPSRRTAARSTNLARWRP